MKNKIIILIVLFLVILCVVYFIRIQRIPDIDSQQTQQIISESNKHFGADFLWYGVQVERTNQQSLDSFKKSTKNLMFEIVRFDVYWGLIEKNKGKYDWTITDDLVNTVDENVDIVFTLYSTSRWGSKYTECRSLAEKEYNRNLQNEPPSTMPDNMNDYTAFLDAIVKRYKDKVKYWQVENEIYGAVKRIPSCPLINRFWIGTEDEYLILLKQSYQTIKRVDPKAKIFASSYTFEPWDGNLKPFFSYILTNANQYSDLWDLHLYLGVDEDPLKITAVKKLTNKTLWTTESGEIDIDYYTYPQFKNNLDSAEELKLQSQDLVKRYVQAFSSGVDKIFRLRVSPLGSKEGPGSRWTHMSLTFDRAGNNKKPAYFTYQVMYSKLSGFDTVEKISEHQYKFINNEKSIIVAWSDSQNQTVDLSQYFTTPDVIVTSIITEKGTSQPNIQTNNAKTVKISQTPVFIENN